MAARKTAAIQLKLRLRPDLHKQLKRAAAKSGRSLNAEIVRRLERTFDFEEFRNITSGFEDFDDTTKESDK